MVSFGEALIKQSVVCYVYRLMHVNVMVGCLFITISLGAVMQFGQKLAQKIADCWSWIASLPLQ